MGREPTVAKELEAETNLGYTNGSRLPIPVFDGASVGGKVWSNDLYLSIADRSK